MTVVPVASAAGRSSTWVRHQSPPLSVVATNWQHATIGAVNVSPIESPPKRANKLLPLTGLDWVALAAGGGFLLAMGGAISRISNKS